MTLPEHLEELSLMRFTVHTPVAVVAFCRDLNGSMKAALTRLIRPGYNDYIWRVWTSAHPLTEEPFGTDEKSARKAFSAACLHATNGKGKQ